MNQKLDPALVKMFDINVNNTPMSDYPVNKLTPLFAFNNNCFNTAAEFVEGFGENVANSKGGEWCQKSVIKMMPYAGKSPAEFNLPQPIIQIRPKFFHDGLMKNGGDSEKALKYCLDMSERNGADDLYCYTGKVMFEDVYNGQCPNLPLPYSEQYINQKVEKKPDKKEKYHPEHHHPKHNKKPYTRKPPSKVYSKKPREPVRYSQYSPPKQNSPLWAVSITFISMVFVILIILYISSKK